MGWSIGQLRRLKTPRSVGFFAIGHQAYWPQFNGLKERLCGYITQVAQHIQGDNLEFINLGMIDDPHQAIAAGHDMRRADVDIIILYVTTYSLSHIVLPVVQRAKVPVLVLNLQPSTHIDYQRFNNLGNRTEMTGEWLAYCASCPMPEIANVFKRAGISFHQLTGTLETRDPIWQELDAWLDAAQVAHTMRHNRLGLMGHYYNGMLDIYSDLTTQVATFGGHMEIIEIEELVAIRQKITEIDIQQKLRQFHHTFAIQDDVDPQELYRAAHTSCALDQLVQEHDLGSLAYYAMGTGVSECEDVMSSIILGTSLLTASGIPVAGEYEIKNAQAMKILDSFGIGGSFTEYYAMDFEDDIVLMGHDGPGHIAIAEGPTKVRPLEVYHGKVGQGLSVEMAVKYGPVTLLSVIEGPNGTLEFLIAEAESVPGPILEIGNTNSRYRFPGGAQNFVENWNAHGPAHHCAIGLGHIANRLHKLAALLGIHATQIC